MKFTYTVMETTICVIILKKKRVKETRIKIGCHLVTVIMTLLPAYVYNIIQQYQRLQFTFTFILLHKMFMIHLHESLWHFDFVAHPRKSLIGYVVAGNTAI